MKKIMSILITLFFVVSPAIYADTGDVPFSVTPVFPDNQSKEITGYFDLKVTPSDQQYLQVKLFNTTTEEIEVEVTANSAVTNANGLIVYDGHVESKQKNPFSQLAEVEEKVIKIAPGQTETTRIKVKAPDKHFKGELLGGLYFLQKSDSKEKDGVQIKNNYAYAIAVRIYEANQNKQVKPELELLQVKPALVDQRTAVEAEFINKQPVMIGQLKFNAQVFRKGSDKPIYVQQIDEFNVAPDGTFKVPMSLNNEALKAGNYVYKANFKDDKKNYHLEKEFTISKKQVEQINNKAVELEKPINWWIYIAIALLFIVALLFYLVMNLKKKIKE